MHAYTHRIMCVRVWKRTRGVEADVVEADDLVFDQGPQNVVGEGDLVEGLREREREGEGEGRGGERQRDRERGRVD